MCLQTVSGADSASAATDKINETLLRNRSEQLYPHLVTDIEPLKPLLEAALDGWIENPHPGSLGGRASDESVEFLADPIAKQTRRSSLTH